MKILTKGQIHMYQVIEYLLTVKETWLKIDWSNFQLCVHPLVAMGE